MLRQNQATVASSSLSRLSTLDQTSPMSSSSNKSNSLPVKRGSYASLRSTSTSATLTPSQPGSQQQPRLSPAQLSTDSKFESSIEQPPNSNRKSTPLIETSIDEMTSLTSITNPQRHGSKSAPNIVDNEPSTGNSHNTTRAFSRGSIGLKQPQQQQQTGVTGISATSARLAAVSLAPPPPPPSNSNDFNMFASSNNRVLLNYMHYGDVFIRCTHVNAVD